MKWSKNLEILYNRIEQERIIPKQWQQVIIKSVEKKGNGEERSKSQRGLILVNIVSKVYEKKNKKRMRLYTTECQKCKQQVKNRDRQQWTTLQ